MARVADVGTESRSVRRAELLLARVRQDCGLGFGSLQAIEPLLTRIDRAVVSGTLPAVSDIEGLANAGKLLESAESLHGGRVTEVLRHDLAAELRDLADRLRIDSARQRQARPRARDLDSTHPGRA